MATDVSVVKSQLNSVKAFMTLKALEACSTQSRGVRDKGEVGVQRDTQDLGGSVQRSHCVADSHLWVESGLVGIGCEQGYAGFRGAMSSCLPSAHLTSEVQSWLALASASTMLGAEASKVKSSA